MEYLKLLGVVIVIVGFALKLDNILIIFVAGAVTAIVGGIDLVTLLQLCGTTFVSNRSMLIFIVIMLATGTLERNGLKRAAGDLIRKFKGSTPGAVVSIYTVLRAIVGAFNVGFGGAAGFIRPVVVPMCEGSIEAKGYTPNEEHMEIVKGMSTGADNIAWFFAQVLVVGGSGAVLVQSTLDSLGYQVEFINLVIVEVPVCIIAVIVACVYYTLKDNKNMKKYYGGNK